MVKVCEVVSEEGIRQVPSIEDLIQLPDDLNQVLNDAQQLEVASNGDP